MKKLVKKTHDKSVTKKSEKKETKRKELNYGLISSLYLACAVIWLISGYINITMDNKSLGILDIVLGVVWFVLFILYYKKNKK